MSEYHGRLQKFLIRTDIDDISHWIVEKYSGTDRVVDSHVSS